MYDVAIPPFPRLPVSPCSTICHLHTSPQCSAAADFQEEPFRFVSFRFLFFPCRFVFLFVQTPIFSVQCNTVFHIFPQLLIVKNGRFISFRSVSFLFFCRSVSFFWVYNPYGLVSCTYIRCAVTAVFTPPSFSVQYHLHIFPQLLIFKNGSFVLLCFVSFRFVYFRAVSFCVFVYTNSHFFRAVPSAHFSSAADIQKRSFRFVSIFFLAVSLSLFIGH